MKIGAPFDLLVYTPVNSSVAKSLPVVLEILTRPTDRWRARTMLEIKEKLQFELREQTIW